MLNGTLQDLDSYLGSCYTNSSDEIAQWAEIAAYSNVDFSLSQQNNKVSYQLDKLARHMNAPNNLQMAGRSLGELMVILAQ